MKKIINHILWDFLETIFAMLGFLWVISGFGIAFISAALEDGHKVFAYSVLIFDLIALVIAIATGIYKYIEEIKTT